MMLAQPSTKTETLWPAELRILFQLGHWQTTDQVLSEALETLREKYPDLKTRAAIEVYRQDSVSFSRAAEIAGTDRWSFQDILRAHGVEVIEATETTEELDTMIRAFEATRQA